MIGVAVIIGILVFVPDQHQSVDFVFTETINNSGFSDGDVLVLRPAARLPADDVHADRLRRLGAHLRGDARARRWAPPRASGARSSGRASIGWFVLLAITFAATDVDAVNDGGRLLARDLRQRADADREQDRRPDRDRRPAVLRHGLRHELLAHVYAFSRDRAVPGHRVWTRLNHHRVPAYAVLGSCAAALIITLPALEGDDAAFPVRVLRRRLDRVIGLYIAYVIPTYLRWRMGDAFEPGPVDAREEVQVDQPGRDHLGRDLRDRLLPAVHAGRRPVARRVRLEVRQLRADHGRRRAARSSASGGWSARGTRSRARSARSSSTTRPGSWRRSRPAREAGHRHLRRRRAGALERLGRGGGGPLAELRPPGPAAGGIAVLLAPDPRARRAAAAARRPDPGGRRRHRRRARSATRSSSRSRRPRSSATCRCSASAAGCR